MTRRWSTWAVATLLASTAGCLASKNDIRLWQDKLRVSRAEAAHADSARAAQADSLRRQLVLSQQQVAAFQEQTLKFFGEADRNQQTSDDSLVAVANRLLSFQANTKESFAHLQLELGQIAEQGRANSALNASIRQALEADTASRALAVGGGGAAANPSDTTRSAQQQVGSDIPAPATLFQGAKEAISKNAFSTARDELNTLIQTYPTDKQDVPTAQLYVGYTFEYEGNQASADSVYTLVVAKYPKTDEAATALFKHGKSLCKGGNVEGARKLFKQIVSDGPEWSTVHADAVTLLSQSNPCS